MPDIRLERFHFQTSGRKSIFARRCTCWLFTCISIEHMRDIIIKMWSIESSERTASFPRITVWNFWDHLDRQKLVSNVKLKCRRQDFENVILSFFWSLLRAHRTTDENRNYDNDDNLSKPFHSLAPLLPKRFLYQGGKIHGNSSRAEAIYSVDLDKLHPCNDPAYPSFLKDLSKISNADNATWQLPTDHLRSNCFWLCEWIGQPMSRTPLRHDLRKTLGTVIKIRLGETGAISWSTKSLVRKTLTWIVSLRLHLAK